MFGKVFVRIIFFMLCPVIQSRKNQLLTMILRAPNEKQNKGNLGQKGLSDNRNSPLAPGWIMISSGSLNSFSSALNKISLASRTHIRFQGSLLVKFTVPLQSIFD